jgi:transposase
MSRREAARVFGIDRGTVAKILKHSVPPGYQRVMPVRRPKLAEHVGFIEQILDEDEAAPRKQRHTAQRIFERLRDERGYDGGYSTVRDYLRPRRQARREVFLPL